MANFAVMDANLIINTIICNDKTTAEQVTGKTCIEYTNANPAEPGGQYINGVFIPKKPYPSWVLVNNKWESPIEEPTSNPEFGWVWDEDALDWVDSQP